MSLFGSADLAEAEIPTITSPVWSNGGPVQARRHSASGPAMVIETGDLEDTRRRPAPAVAPPHRVHPQPPHTGVGTAPATCQYSTFATGSLTVNSGHPKSHFIPVI